MAPDEEPEPEAKVVSTLADKDPVPPLGTGILPLGVLVVLGVFVHGGLPWSFPPEPGTDGGDAVTLAVLGLFVGSLLAWALIGWGLLITAAKVDDIWEMLRRQRVEPRED